MKGFTKKVSTEEGFKKLEVYEAEGAIEISLGSGPEGHTNLVVKATGGNLTEKEVNEVLEALGDHVEDLKSYKERDSDFIEEATWNSAVVNFLEEFEGVYELQ